MTRDGWTIVTSAPRGGLWRVSAHRSAPDGWAMLPGRWASEAEALAAAEAWLPSAEPCAPPPAPPPDSLDTTPAEPIPAPADPRQLSLWSR